MSEESEQKQESEGLHFYEAYEVELTEDSKGNPVWVNKRKIF